jgi:hypothetical protein
MQSYLLAAFIIVVTIVVFIVREVVQKIEKIKQNVDKIVSILPARGWGLIAVCIIGVVLYALPTFITLTILLGSIGLAMLPTALVIIYRQKLSWWCAVVIVGEFILGGFGCYCAIRGWLLLHPRDFLWVEGAMDVAMLATLALCWFLSY